MRGGAPVSLAVALLAAVALQVELCAAQCPPNTVQVEVVGQASSVGVPALPEGGYFWHNCSSVHSGYVGSVEVRCVGLSLVAYTHACSPRACPAGQSASARVGANQLVSVDLSSELAHGATRRVACKTLLPGFDGHARVACRLGELQADASNCRQKVDGPRSMLRVSNGDYLAGTWRVFELSLYASPDCSGEKLQGEIFASSEDYSGQATHDMAFDGDRRTVWDAGCERGCLPGVAWLGLATPGGFESAGCLRLLQSQVACCGSRRIRLEVWDGAEWQTLQVWDTQGMRRLTYGFQLTVPITCHLGKPEGTGILHDCDGLPVVGRQEGEVCEARCADGYYGGVSKYTCGADGRFQGEGTTCYHVETMTRILVLAGVLAALSFLGFQYKFFFMHRKPKLTSDDDMIPKAMYGRWLEKNGTNVWEVILEEKNRELNRSVYDFAAEEKGKAEEQEQAGEKDAKAKKKGARSKKKAAMKEAEAAVAAKAAKEEAERMASQGFDALDGLCSPCEDPMVCLTCIFCPTCRMADTWHTLGKPSWQSYWKIYFAYTLFPCLWPCLSFFGRLRVRRFFQIPLEPHRDCLIYCCCCCCCAPCAACQEARLVDAPIFYQKCYKKRQDQNSMDVDDEEV